MRGGCRQMLLPFANLPAPSEGSQKHLVDMPVEGRELQPLFEIAERFVARNAPDKMLQQRGVAAAESPPLRGQPAVEGRVAVDFQALEKIAVEQHRQRSLTFRCERLDALVNRAGDLDRIDETMRQVEADHVAAGLDALAVAVVDDAADLAQAPAQLSARIVGDVPQQFAKLAPRHGERGQGQVGEERAHLSRRRQSQRDAVTADRHGAEHAHLNPRPAARFPGFHAHSHGHYHARLHVGLLRLNSKVATHSRCPA